MIRVLNLYAGIGGNRKLWKGVEVTAIEYEPNIAKVYQDFYPNDIVIVADAHQYLLDHFREYDFIWSSPPCPTHSDIRRAAIQGGLYNGFVYPDMSLYQEIILLKHFGINKWVIENVKPYYNPLIPPTFELHRHYFWSNFYVKNINIKDDRIHDDIVGTSTVYGFNLNKYENIGDKRKMLRNMVNPEVANYIFNSAFNIQEEIQDNFFNDL